MDTVTEQVFHSYEEQLHDQWTLEKWQHLQIAKVRCIELEKAGFTVLLPRWHPRDDFASFHEGLSQAISKRKHQEVTHINREIVKWRVGLEPRIAEARLHFGDGAASWLNSWRTDRINIVLHTRRTGHLRDPDLIELCQARWMGRKGHVATLDLPNVTSTRFNHLHGRVVNTICKYEWYIDPPGMLTADQVNQYCENMTRSVNKHLINSVENSWGPIATRDQATRERYNRMCQKVSLGFDPYGPDEPSPFADEQFKDFMSWNAPRFGRDITGIAEGNWVFKSVLGAGGFGCASIWVRCDDTGLILDRMAVKESYSRRDWTWDAESNWEGPKANRLPLEYALQTLLSNAPDNESIVQCRAYGLYEWMRMYRLYMEYCPHSDLETSIRLYKKYIQEGYNVRFPDRALWCIFERLAGAACLMSQGYLPGSGPAEHEHRAVVHRDLKPENIFWAAQSKTWPKLPTAKVGDFGLAGYADTENVLHGFAGTPGYMPPEQCSFGNPFPVTSKADVWTIGRIMLSLVNLSDNNETLYWLPNEPEHHQAPVGFKQGSTNDRDMQLLALIQGCLQPVPDNRPDASELYGIIQSRIAERPRVMELKLGGAWDQHEYLFFRPDLYANLAQGNV